MKWLDVVLLVLIASYSTYIIFAKKKTRCSGDCGNCKGCVDKK